MDRKTVRRYVAAAEAAGLKRDEGEDQLSDAFIGEVTHRVQSRGPGRHGATWMLCEAHRGRLKGWVDKGLKLTKVRVLLERHTGQTVPYRTLHRFARSELGYRKVKETVRVDDPEPGQEIQVDFGRMGRIKDKVSGRLRVVWALIFTAVWSRHSFVWLSYGQRLEDVIAGFERAWSFFGGVFPVVIIDNMKAVVNRANPLKPVINESFMEYAQARGFVIDTARVRHADDKPRVERAVPYVRDSFFAGEHFADLREAQAAAEHWCLHEAGTRVHGTTCRRPLDAFAEVERELLLKVTEDFYDPPIWSEATVHRDRHVPFLCALYSAGDIDIGEKVKVRGDRRSVKIFHRGRLVRVHPRKPRGERSTHPDDIPEGRAIYARRDTQALLGQAKEAGVHVGQYASRLLDSPLPWTSMRHVYRLLGLVRRYGSAPVDQACSRALDIDVIDVTRISRIVEQAIERRSQPEQAPAPPGGTLRFLRAPTEYQRSFQGGDDV
jgi:transposase